MQHLGCGRTEVDAGVVAEVEKDVAAAMKRLQARNVKQDPLHVE